MTRKKISEFYAYRQLIIKLCAMVGAWSSKNPSVLSRVIPYIQLTIYLGMAFTIFEFARIHYSNILIVTRALSSMMSFIMNSIKITCLIVHRESIFKLQDLLDIHFNNLLEKKYLTKILLKKMNTYRFLFMSFMFFGFGIPLAQIILSLYSNLYQYYHHVQPVHNVLIYPCSYPWTTPSSGLYFQLHFIFESMAAISLAWISSCFDGLFTLYIFLIIGQLREISYEITHIKNTDEREIVIDKCIIQYSAIMQYCYNIEKIYGPIIVYMIATNSITLCFLMFQITQMKTISVIRMLFFFAYFSTKLLQSLIYTWCGTQLTIESEEYRKAVYAANWYENKRAMNNIIIMLQQRPLILTACGMTDVSIHIFVKIINTTISYYLMLKTLEISK